MVGGGARGGGARALLPHVEGCRPILPQTKRLQMESGQSRYQPGNASTKRLILFDPCSSLVCTFHAVHAEEKQEVPTREKIAVVGAGFCGLGIAGAFTVNPFFFSS